MTAHGFRKHLSCKGRTHLDLGGAPFPPHLITPGLIRVLSPRCLRAQNLGGDLAGGRAGSNLQERLFGPRPRGVKEQTYGFNNAVTPTLLWKEPVFLPETQNRGAFAPLWEFVKMLVTACLLGIFTFFHCAYFLAHLSFPELCRTGILFLFSNYLISFAGCVLETHIIYVRIHVHACIHTQVYPGAHAHTHYI